MLDEIYKFFDTQNITSLKHYMDNYAKFIKSLKDRVQPVQEWSEEDERSKNAAIQACKYMVDNFENSTKQYDDAINWLKSLKPQNTWKPSDEQMKALEMAINEQKEEYGFTSLDSLYEQLKAL